MLLLKTSFSLRPDLLWEDLYKKSIYAWINGSENKKTNVKNYAGLLRVLPRTINLEEKKEDKFEFGGDSLSYSFFQQKKEEFFGYDFIYSEQNRKWDVRIVFKRAPKCVFCCVSVSCEVIQASGIPSIAKPRIIDYLLNEFQDGPGDGGIAISDDAHFIETSDSQTAVNILKGKNKNKLPIVYLSCYEHHALRPKDVARKLYGVAHVFAERDKYLSDRIGIEVKGRFPKGGEIAICYPTHPPIIINRKDDDTWKKDPDVLVQDIFKKILRQSIASKAEFSWDDYQAAYTAYLKNKAEQEKASVEEMKRAQQQDIEKLLEMNKHLQNRLETEARLREEAEKECESAKEELKSFTDNFDDENELLKQKIEELQQDLYCANNARDAAEGGIKALKQKVGPSFPLLIPNEPEKYDSEYMNHIICALKIAIPKGAGKNCSCRQRNLDVWQNILDANPDAVARYNEYCKLKDELLRLAKKEELKTTKGQKLMRQLGLDFSKKENNHGDVCFPNDDRYTGIESSTSSDHFHGGKNEAAAIERAFFCSHK